MSQERTIGERLYAVRRTVLQMLHDRGYMVDQNDIDQSEKDFFEKFSTSPQRDALTLLVQRRGLQQQQMRRWRRNFRRGWRRLMRRCRRNIPRPGTRFTSAFMS